MPLTKSEFDRLMAERKHLLEQAESRLAAMKDRPRSIAGRFTDGGLLDIVGALSFLDEEKTRALYEMLRAWYGESLMTEKAKAVIERAIEWRGWRMAVHPAELALNDAVDAYRAEQKR